MRAIIIGLCLLCVSPLLRARSVDGVGVYGGGAPVLVYVDGERVCPPSSTCFIANLPAGRYLIEVFEAAHPLMGERSGKGRRLFSERVHFDGKGVKRIVLDGRRPEVGYESGLGVMEPELFEQFLKAVEKESFSDNMMKMIKNSLPTTRFTSAQCVALAGLFSFESKKVELMKLLYPNVADKEAFFTVVSTLQFSSDREKVNKFVREWSKGAHRP